MRCLAVRAGAPSLKRAAPSVTLKLADDGILGVGVIGAGRIGMVHLEALSKCGNAKAVIISNPTISKAEAAAAQYNLDAFSGDADDVINHPDVEAVWICSPSSFDISCGPDSGMCGGWKTRFLREPYRHRSAGDDRGDQRLQHGGRQADDGTPAV